MASFNLLKWMNINTKPSVCIEVQEHVCVCVCVCVFSCICYIQRTCFTTFTHKIEVIVESEVLLLLLLLAKVGVRNRLIIVTVSENIWVSHPCSY